MVLPSLGGWGVVVVVVVYCLASYKAGSSVTQLSEDDQIHIKTWLITQYISSYLTIPWCLFVCFELYTYPM